MMSLLSTELKEKNTTKNQAERYHLLWKLFKPSVKEM